MTMLKRITSAATRHILRPGVSKGRTSLNHASLQPEYLCGWSSGPTWAASVACPPRHRAPLAPQRPAPACCAASDATAAAPAATSHTHCVVNFYHLCDVTSPGQTAQDHRALIAERGWDIRGRIYISHQGVNAQFSGPIDEALAYTNWLAEQPEFRGVQWRTYPVPRHMFPKLKLKYRPNLISLQGGMQGLPVVDPGARATPLPPSDWKAMLANAKRVNAQRAAGASEERVVVLDVRNSYEWDAGHFAGAERPLEDEFRETPAGGEAAVPEYLKNVDPETPVMMYCTGGIRCDIYSTFLRKQGFKKLYTLEGGIQNYLDQEGAVDWNGSLYVFDDRMAVSAGNMDGAVTTDLPAAAGCQLCGARAQLPHINCANVDCNLLFLACPSCKERLQGCCCEECLTNPPRLLRPVKDGSSPYRGMTNYTPPMPGATKALMSDEKKARLQASREKRRARLRQRYQEQKEKKRVLKAQAKARMAQDEEAERSSEARVEAANAA